MGTKYTMGIRRRMGDPVSEKEPLGIPGNADNKKEQQRQYLNRVLGWN